MPGTHLSSKPPEAVPSWSAQKKKLLQFREHLCREAGAPIEPAEMSDSFETASDEFELHMQTALRDTAIDLLAEVNAALERIQLGTYGICEETGRRIDEERLLAIPWTRHTKEAQEELEHEKAHGAGRHPSGMPGTHKHGGSCGHGKSAAGCGPNPCLNCRRQ